MVFQKEFGLSKTPGRCLVYRSLSPFKAKRDPLERFLRTRIDLETGQPSVRLRLEPFYAVFLLRGQTQGAGSFTIVPKKTAIFLKSHIYLFEAPCK